ncbi:MAG: UDP-N-acetylmuramoyl-L-alanyl-D-glutamate--2,6-diaminopimelate ligase [Spirochaetota bacterium]
MKLKELIQKSRCCEYTGRDNPDISKVSTDSRKVSRGDIFVAIEGYRDNGIRYIREAVKRGAGAVVVERKFREQLEVVPGVPLCYTDSARRCALLLARTIYDFEGMPLSLIGITGTNGKTTITYLLEALLRECNCNPGVIGTISYRYNSIEKKAHNTTPDPVELMGLFAEMASGGVTHVIMEVSSHALAQDRVLPNDFDFAIFTNLSQDHLDYHGTMEEYGAAKARLFTGLEPAATAIINIDDPFGERLVSTTEGRVITYGMKEACDYRASIQSLSLTGTKFSVNGIRFSTHLIGVHNVYNMIPAIAYAETIGLDRELVVKALANVRCIPGRFERVDNDRGFHLFVDYAHTPDALDHLLDAANMLKDGRIITVFGCGGDRDRGKRPKMGRIVEEKSDLTVITSDNPRTEDPLLIIEDIKKGLRKNNHLVIPDRKEAIYKAVELAAPGDIVLIAGKGHEDYQILKDRTIHFDDREVAMEALKSLP